MILCTSVAPFLQGTPHPSFVYFTACEFGSTRSQSRLRRLTYEGSIHQRWVQVGCGPGRIFFYFFYFLFFLRIFLFIYLFIYLFIFYFWLHWVLVAACRLSLVAVSGGYSSLWCVGFSLWWLLLLRSMGSRHAGFSSCGTRAQ